MNGSLISAVENLLHELLTSPLALSPELNSLWDSEKFPLRIAAPSIPPLTHL